MRIPPRERQRDAERVSKISASAWRRPTLASRFLSEQVGVRQASQIGFSKPPFSESLVDDLRSLSCLTYRLTGIRCYSPKFSGSHSNLILTIEEGKNVSKRSASGPAAFNSHLPAGVLCGRHGHSGLDHQREQDYRAQRRGVQNHGHQLVRV